MSDPLSNSEIQDVLSSIRRLVSEDRRAREAKAPVDAAPGTPVIGKLILTEALRVETAEEVTVEDVTAEIDEAPFTALAEEPEAEDVPAVASAVAPPPVRAASVLADDIASLESTIAELEAAVAGIGTEFEPDGSEVAATADTPEARALEDAFDEGFAVDTGDPVRVAPADDPLDEPVSGGAFRRGAKAFETESATEEPLNAPTPAVDEIAFVRSPGVMRRVDWQVISGGEAGPAPLSRLHLRPAGGADEPEETGSEEQAAFAGDMIGAEVAAEVPAVIDNVAEVVEDEPSAAGVETAEDLIDQDSYIAAAADVSAETVEPDAEASFTPVEADELLTEMVAEAESGRAEDDLVTPAEAAETGLAEDAEAASGDEVPGETTEAAENYLAWVRATDVETEAAIEPAVEAMSDPAEDAPSAMGEEIAADLRESPESDLLGGDAAEPADDPAAVEIPVDLDTPILAAAGLAGAAAALPKIADDAEAAASASGKEVDLFASSDEAVIDMETLRELIVQVLREELQGPLGERITRNVRKLVRQEIARALEAQKFE